MPYGPLFGIHWAVNGFFEDQRISTEDAIRAATAGGAYASFSENETGTLEAGKVADFVILRGDPFETPERIAQLRIGATWIGGERVYGGSPRGSCFAFVSPLGAANSGFHPRSRVPHTLPSLRCL